MTSERLCMLASILEIDVDFLEECIRCGVIRLEDIPEDRGEISACEQARLRRLRRICCGLEIDVYAGSIIVDLLGCMDELRRELDRRGGAAQ